MGRTGRDSNPCLWALRQRTDLASAAATSAPLSPRYRTTSLISDGGLRRARHCSGGGGCYRRSESQPGRPIGSGFSQWVLEDGVEDIPVVRGARIRVRPSLDQQL